MVEIMAPVSQKKMERVGHWPVVEPGCFNSRALLLNLTPVCFPSLCYKAVFPSLRTALAAERFFVVGALPCIVRCLAASWP